MSRIAILSDAHLLIQAERFRDENYRSPRGEISLKNFTNVVSQVIAEEPEAVILAGDMFDEREKGGDWIADSEAALLKNGMRQIKKIGLVTIAVIVVLVGLWMYHAHGLYKKSYRSEYYYVITVQSNSILHDVKIFVPIPLFEEKSKIGDQIIAEKASNPDDWDCRIVETEHGKMLEISVAKIT
ncbi:unnamed protein product, partial [marine sediment metagenome]